ncbi:MAG: cytochrome C [Candidatus Methanoperedens sp.]|nr:cytochrome C [Candidatus Methanoperedens sp.]
MLKEFLICVAAFVLFAASAGNTTALTDQEQLGKNLFFDHDLSQPKGQDCAACHAPSVGFTGDHDAINKHGAVYEGAVTERFGNRKPPTAAYAGDSPILDLAKGTWTGGMFWDGRATGWTLRDPLAEQALGPFLNPLEQNLPDPSEVVSRVSVSSYGGLFNKVCGSATVKYDCIGRAIAAYERSADVTSFTSKFDLGKLTKQEKDGLALFKGKGKCDRCHLSKGKKPVFTDYTYDNLGIPRNPENPFYNEPLFNPLGVAWVDEGLGGFLYKDPTYFNVARTEIGKEKVPTLRNVAKGSCETELDNPNCVTKAYGHNGYFKSLKSIVHFYNTRDVLPVCGGIKNAPGVDCWPLPEVGLNINMKEVGNLGLTPGEEDDIVAFLNALSDTYTALPP